MEQAKESIKRQKKKVFRNFIALMAGSLTLLISIAIKFNFSYAKIIVNCAICIFRKNRALAPHERSAVPLGTDHCPVG